MSKSKAVKTIEENKRRTFLATEITKPLNLSTISISKAINQLQPLDIFWVKIVILFQKRELHYT